VERDRYRFVWRTHSVGHTSASTGFEEEEDETGRARNSICARTVRRDATLSLGRLKRVSSRETVMKKDKRDVQQQRA
jgi:hypothetical protein